MSAPLSLSELGPQVVEAIGRFLSGDISFAELQSQTGLSADELAQCLPDYVGSVNNYALTQGGDQVVQLPSYTPPAPGAHESVYEASIEQYQYNIVNNVTVDNSEDITQVINNYGDGDVNAQIADDGGVNVGAGATLDDTLINTGDITDSNVANVGDGSTVTQTGDVTAGAGAAVNTGPGGTAETTGSGNTFGDGGTNQAVSDSTDVNQSDVDVDLTGTGGGNAAGGAGGDGGAGGSGDGGFGGPGGPGGAATGGADSDGIDDSPVTIDVQQDVDNEPEPDPTPTIL